MLYGSIKRISDAVHMHTDESLSPTIVTSSSNLAWIRIGTANHFTCGYCYS